MPDRKRTRAHAMRVAEATGGERGRAGYGHIRGRRGWRIVLGMGMSGVGLALLGWMSLPWVPLPDALQNETSGAIELVDREGRSLRLVREGEEPFQQRVEYAAFPQALVQATLAAEDARFWRHPGVDGLSILRAAWQGVRHGRIVSGGSTITQQLIKQVAPRGRTLGAKAFEALRALRIEQVWDKQRILGEYLNRVEYGNVTVGVSAAARFYFGKRVEDLSPAECALLAALPQAPTRLDPLRHPERARKRQLWILDRMRQLGWLTVEEHVRAIHEPLRWTAKRPFAAPHFADFVLRQPPSGSGVLRTTIDLELNRVAERILQERLLALRGKHVHNGAVVVLDNRTGDVLALVGSEDYFGAEAGQVNGVWAPRPAGSTLKPFTYALALERGATAATVVGDVPVSFTTATGVFAPENYDRRYRGPVSYREALGCSLNIPAVRVLDALGGPAPLIERLQVAGLTTLTKGPEYYGLGLTLGNAEVRLLELANAYACLGRLGEYRPWRVVMEPQIDPTTAEGTTRALFSRSAAWLVADMLSDNVARAGAFGLDSALRFDFPVACKTGTSTGFRDNWAFGYTPEFTVGVWVGNFDGTPMRDVSGVTGAAPVLRDVFEFLHGRYGTSWYAEPEGLVAIEVNRLTGKQWLDGARAGRRDPRVVREKFLPPALPEEETTADYDALGRVRLGVEYGDWWVTGAHGLAEQTVVEAGRGVVSVVFPPPGTTLFIDNDLPDGGRQILLTAQGGGDLVWASPTLCIDRTGERQAARLLPGRHELTVRDTTTGTMASTWVMVRER